MTYTHIYIYKYASKTRLMETQALSFVCLCQWGCWRQQKKLRNVAVASSQCTRTSQSDRVDYELHYSKYRKYEFPRLDIETPPFRPSSPHNLFKNFFDIWILDPHPITIKSEVPSKHNHFLEKISSISRSYLTRAQPISPGEAGDIMISSQLRLSWRSI